MPKAIQKFTGNLKGIYFATASAQIQRKSHKVLDRAVKVLKQFPSIRISVAGHTHDQGPADKNLKLSEDRAAAVRQYLVSQGIAADRIISKGFGESKPVAEGTSKAARAKNRRIELTIIGQ